LIPKVCNHPFLCNGLEQDYTDKKRRGVDAAAVKVSKPYTLNPQP